MDFSNLTIDISVADIRKGTRLGELKSFRVNEPDIKQLAKYVVLVYDPDSPFRIKYPNLDKRKLEVAVWVGYDLKEDADRLEDIMSLRSAIVAEMVYEFLLTLPKNNKLWMLIISNEETFYEFQRALQSGVEFTKDDRDKLQTISIKDKLLDSSETILARLDALYKKMFEEPEIVDKAQKKRITPENMAQ